MCSEASWTIFFSSILMVYSSFQRVILNTSNIFGRFCKFWFWGKEEWIRCEMSWVHRLHHSQQADEDRSWKGQSSGWAHKEPQQYHKTFNDIDFCHICYCTTKAAKCVRWVKELLHYYLPQNFQSILLLRLMPWMWGMGAIMFQRWPATTSICFVFCEISGFVVASLFLLCLSSWHSANFSTLTQRHFCWPSVTSDTNSSVLACCIFSRDKYFLCWIATTSANP